MKQENRKEIERRCNEAIGETSSVLCTVISHFPKTAELFIITQNHAAEVEGRRHVWYTVQHKKSGTGLQGEYYNAGQMEHLGVHGYTGESLMKIITAVSVMRGEERGFLDEAVGDILRTASKISSLCEIDSPKQTSPLTDYEQIVGKALKVMNVTTHEISLLRAYANAYKHVDALRQQAQRLLKQAEQFGVAAHLLFPKDTKEKQKSEEDDYNKVLQFRQEATTLGLTLNKDDNGFMFALDLSVGGMLYTSSDPTEVFKLITLAYQFGRSRYNRLAPK